MLIRMPTCAARRVAIAWGIAGMLGCSSADDIYVSPTVDSGVDASHDSSIMDGAHDSSTPDSSPVLDSGMDTSVSDSGSDAGSDTGPEAGVDAGVDSGVVCSGKSGFGYVGVSDAGSSCGTGESYSCGVDNYQILCECPAKACTCEKGGVKVGTVAYAGCPACSAPTFSTVAAGCGVPY